MKQTPARLRGIPTKYVEGVAQVVAGLALAAFPAFFLAIYARIAPIEDQGFLAVSLAVGSYVGVVLSAFIVESRLATPGAQHPVALPRWMAVVSAAGGGLLILGPPVPPAPVLLIAVVGLTSGLLMARSIGVVSGRWKMEAAAAITLLVGCCLALLLATLHNPLGLRVLAGGAVITVAMRLWNAPHDGHSGIPPDLRRAAWVSGETAVVGIVQPALTTLILVILGPAASVAFRVISTIAGALEPILAYGRLRLLAYGHKGEIAVIAVAFGGGLAMIFCAEALGVWRLIFGPAWAGVTVTGLLIACLWKGLILGSTVPFAAVRRAGRTTLVFWARCACTAIYLILGVAFVMVFRTNTAAFASFVVTEVLSILIYYSVAKRTAWRKP
ncbi:hypothetical protein [Mycolicibacterium baixiangningiae]|uniref:hypothetical protein n=1 Tax=Mycolicibacterium baixiangningiae TaxID=2761578 RepID=UPI0018685B1C|nr:hypothetical protein [Mycolicibacterium baixiangningiae]